MTNNPNQGFFFRGGEDRGGGSRTVYRVKEGWTGEVREIILINDTLYNPYTYCYKFSSSYSIRLPC